MSILLLAAYCVIALLVASISIFRMASVRPRRNRYIDRMDQAVLVLTVLAASAAWGLLLPLHFTGWLSSGRGRALRQRLGHLPRLRPDPIFRERLYQSLH